MSLTESELIAEICRRVHHHPSPVGPGDDGAVIGELVIATDTMVQGTHFLRRHPPHWLGWKLLSINLSDIAAMGVKPTGFLLSAALPHDTSSDWWSAFCDGLAEVAHAHQVVISGGDTVRSDGVMTLTVTAWGRREGERVLQRDGARVGDRLMLYPGAGVGVSAAGLSRWINLQSEDDWPAHQMDAIQDESIIAHLRPQPPLWAGPWALVHGASAGMDCSDGLIQDIRRLGLASNVGFRVDLGTLEEDPRCGSMSRIERAAGGEDYGLIVTVPEEKYVPFRTRGFTSLGLAVEPAQGVQWFDGGESLAVQSPGFMHFDNQHGD